MAVQDAAPYRPLVYAVSAHEAGQGYPMSTTRKKAHARTFAMGAAVSAETRSNAKGAAHTQFFAGSSIAAATMTGIAAAYWAGHWGNTAHEIMANIRGRWATWHDNKVARVANYVFTPHPTDETLDRLDADFGLWGNSPPDTNDGVAMRAMHCQALVAPPNPGPDPQGNIQEQDLPDDHPCYFGDEVETSGSSPARWNAPGTRSKRSDIRSRPGSKR